MAVAASLLMAAISCAKMEDKNTEPDNPNQGLKISTKSADFVQKGLPFTFDYIGRINDATEENYFISPLSMQFLLGMILNGTRGETADEICTVLGYGTGEEDAVNKYCLSLLQQLPGLDKKTTLGIANAIVVNGQYSLLDAYQETVG
jgi:serpin B